MRLTILRGDATVIKDGRAIRDMDLSTLPEFVRVVQFESWEFGSEGWIECYPYNGQFVPNAPITSIADYQSLVDQWQTRADAEDAEAAAAAEAAAVAQAQADEDAKIAASQGSQPDDEALA
jgi:hypothetical protein